MSIYLLQNVWLLEQCWCLTQSDKQHLLQHMNYTDIVVLHLLLFTYCLYSLTHKSSIHSGHRQ